MAQFLWIEMPDLIKESAVLEQRCCLPSRKGRQRKIAENVRTAAAKAVMLQSAFYQLDKCHWGVMLKTHFQTP